jgi:hypothetical protein
MAYGNKQDGLMLHSLSDTLIHNSVVEEPVFSTFPSGARPVAADIESATAPAAVGTPHLNLGDVESQIPLRLNVNVTCVRLEQADIQKIGQHHARQTEQHKQQPNYLNRLPHPMIVHA